MFATLMLICSHNLNFAIFLYHQIREINMSQKFHVIRTRYIRFLIKFLSIFFLNYLNINFIMIDWVVSLEFTVKKT